MKKKNSQTKCITAGRPSSVKRSLLVHNTHKTIDDEKKFFPFVFILRKKTTTETKLEWKKHFSSIFKVKVECGGAQRRK